MIVKRVKAATGADGKAGPAQTHYVSALFVGPTGRVSVAALSPDRAGACDVAPEQWDQLRAAYKDRPGAGAFSAEGARPERKAADAPQG